MFNVPKLRFGEFEGEWVEKPIENILKIGSGKDYKHLEKGTIPVYGTGGYMTSVNDYLYDGESVCIGRKGTIDKPRFINGKFWTVDTLFFTHSWNNSIPKFVYSLFQKINWKKYNEASGVPSLSKKTIEKIKINIPSLEEQQKIATFLTSIDQKIEQLNQKKTLFESYKKGVMQKIFSQEIRFKCDDGGEFEDWEEIKLKDITTVITKGTTPTSIGFNFVNKGINFIKVENISKNFIIDIINTPKISEDCNQSLQRSILFENDIVFSIAGTLGRTAIIETKDLPANTNQALSIIRLKKNQNIKFINYCLNILLVKKYIKQMVSVGAQPNINLEQVGNIKLNLPSLKEQEKIATFLTSIDQKITQNNQILEQMKAFKKGLLQQMFV